MKTAFIITLASALMLQSCGNSTSNSALYASNSIVAADDAEFMVEEEIMPMASQSNVAFRKNATFGSTNEPTNQTINVEKKIIRNGQMEIETADIVSTKATIDSLVAIFNGYYSSESYNNRWNERYSLCIRIPCGNFDAFLNCIENGNGKVTYKNISTNDVTEQFVDIETRLENKRKYIEQYKVLLKQAQKVSEIASISDQIRCIEEEIESTTGRLKYLNNQVNFSTLNLEITNQETKAEADNSFVARLRKAFKDGSSFFSNSIIFVAKHWQAIMSLGVIAALLYCIKRKRKANKQV